MKDFDASGVIPLAEKFMKDAKAEGKPFFVWLDTRLNDKWFYAAEQNTSEADYHGSGMMRA